MSIENVLHVPQLRKQLLITRDSMNKSEKCIIEQFNKVNAIIETLPLIERFILKNDMCYKFSKSRPEYAELFSERQYKEYPEFKYVVSSAEMGLSFVANEIRLFDFLCYGNQLTQISFSTKHPFFEKIRCATVQYESISKEICQCPILLSGYNMSLKDPYVLKSIMIRSDNPFLFNLLDKPLYVKKSVGSIVNIYKELGFLDTYDFCMDLIRYPLPTRIDEAKFIIEEVLPSNEDIIKKYCKKFEEHCNKNQVI